MTPDDIRNLVRGAPDLWSEINLVHRSRHHEIRAVVRHGELLATSVSDGRRIPVTEGYEYRGRLVEPFPTNYLWSAMLDPNELGDSVTYEAIDEGRLFGRPVVSFVGRATPGYDPICPCCPLIFSEASDRAERGDGWAPNTRDYPDGVELAIDLGTGIVVSSRDRGGDLADWFTNEILGAS